MTDRKFIAAVIMVLALVVLPAGCATLNTSGRSAGVSARQPEAYYHYLRSQLYLNDREDELALEHLRAAVQADPGSTFLESELARFYRRRNQMPEALDHARAAVAKNPDDVQARLLVANLLTIMKRNEEAIAEYERLLGAGTGTTKRPCFSWAPCTGKGNARTRPRRFFGALLEMRPDSYLAYYYLGMLAQEREDYDTAAADYRKGRGTEPGVSNRPGRTGFGVRAAEQV